MGALFHVSIGTLVEEMKGNPFSLLVDGLNDKPADSEDL